ncbi:hypothetical protein BJX76DRAFT_339659 [Aspergillus varians]
MKGLKSTPNEYHDQGKTWRGCSRSIKASYLRYKLEQHATEPSEFTVTITKILELDDFKTVTPRRKA